LIYSLRSGFSLQFIGLPPTFGFTILLIDGVLGKESAGEEQNHEYRKKRPRQGIVGS
jgi:hypothetical protein